MPAEYSVTVPDVVIFPTRLPLYSVNHRLPSGPAAMPRGPAPLVMPAEYSVTNPDGVILPIPPTNKVPVSVNHRLPSGPAAIPFGCACAVMPNEYSVTVPVVPVAPAGADANASPRPTSVTTAAYARRR